MEFILLGPGEPRGGPSPPMAARIVIPSPTSTSRRRNPSSRGASPRTVTAFNNVPAAYANHGIARHGPLGNSWLRRASCLGPIEVVLARVRRHRGCQFSLHAEDPTWPSTHRNSGGLTGRDGQPAAPAATPPTAFRPSRDATRSLSVLLLFGGQSNRVAL
jgi:hypothetical protein